MYAANVSMNDPSRSLSIPIESIWFIYLSLLIIFFINCLDHLYSSAIIRRYVYPSHLLSLYDQDLRLITSINTLRHHSNQVNTPATFTDYAKIQRQLQTAIKQERHIKEEIYNITKQSRYIIYRYMITYIPLFIIIIILYLSYGSIIIIHIPATSHWVNYTPIKVSRY